MQLIKVETIWINLANINSIGVLDDDCIEIFLDKPVFGARKYGFDGLNWTCLDDELNQDIFSDFLWSVELKGLENIQSFSNSLGTGLA